ncbi:MAG TPA: hypothetical protein VK444_00990 [Methanobacteriaceae archaeon]|nr:hypothetical protein [Methanobacteriaceae archaeon]
MINLIVAIFGVLLVIAGFYFMYLGISTPPNPLFFFIGLISTVLGMIMVVFFGSRINMSRDASVFKASGTRKIVKPENLKEIAVKKPPKKVEPKKAATIKPAAKPQAVRPAVKPPKKVEPKKAAKPQTVKPVAKSSSPPIKPKAEVKTEPKPKAEVKKPAKIQPKPKSEPKAKTEPKFGPQIKSSSTEEPGMKKITPRPKDVSPPSTVKKLSEDIPKKVETPEPAIAKPVADEKESKKPLKPDLEKLKAESDSKLKDEHYVKNRLERLKENYILNTKDIESLVDERLDSFKGTLTKLKSETKDPSIIWSFDAQDVQEALKDTLSQAEHRILMMYPWVRNIDISILKKFMDTESRMIIQEASLDDDASVELIQLLLENDVKIKTMPHVHTVAVVADDNNGLIISTDPIYESYEVGVIYRDQKSIEEIERMFEDAWNLSKEMDLEIRK